jgi:hypothetical protein
VGSVTGIKNSPEGSDPPVVFARDHSFRSLGGPALAAESQSGKTTEGRVSANQRATILPTHLTSCPEDPVFIEAACAHVFDERGIVL